MCIVTKHTKFFVSYIKQAKMQKLERQLLRLNTISGQFHENEWQNTPCLKKRPTSGLL